MLGYPEVRLGLVPEAGGSQRLPRLVGAAAALDVLLSGRAVPAPLATKTGMIDGAVAGDPVAHAVRYVQGQVGRRCGARADPPQRPAGCATRAAISPPAGHGGRRWRRAG